MPADTPEVLPLEHDIAAASASPPVAEPRRVTVLSRQLRDNGIIVACAAAFLFLAIDSGNFLTSSNLLNLVDQQTSVGLIAFAGTLVLICGCFDLSVGAIYALCGVIAAKVTNSGGPVEGMVVALAFGTALGACNGVLVTVMKINPLIATLSTNIIYGGVALAITSGALVPVTPASFAVIGNSKPLGVYWSTWILVAFGLIMAVLLARTRFGRYVYAAGGNEEAARLSGVRLGQVRTVTYMLSGLACAIGAILYTSRVQTADPSIGSAFALTAIASMVVGGVSIRGGEGAIWRTAIGLLLLGMIADGFNLLNFNPDYQQIVQGAIILAAVGLDVVAKRNRR
jgi:ribose transport system permease protein